MARPIVAIVGRPNVGKSSMFNWLIGRRVSIVDPTAGVTRDRISSTIEIGNRHIDIMDTGGMGIEDVDQLTEEVERQIRLAIEQADVIIFLVDSRDGVVPLDEEVARRLRAVDKPVICVANKCDYPELDTHASEFYRLGYGDVVRVSAEQRKGKRELFDAILRRLPEKHDEAPPAQVTLKVAIVGRRNVGKSTFINALAESERVIVSEVAGTTRDSVDVHFERDGKTFIAIDTAGVRRKKSLANDIEFYSSARAEQSIRRADVVLHLFDPRLRISKLDKQLADYVLEHHKPVIFVVNKWDLVKTKMPMETFTNYIRKTFPMLDFVPIAFITAKEGRNIYRLLNLAQQLFKQASKRVTTGELNRVLTTAMEVNPPPVKYNRFPKLYYATQAEANPPTVIAFTNAVDLFDNTYIRYLHRVLHDQTPFKEVPIKLELRNKIGNVGSGSKGSPAAASLTEHDLDMPTLDGETLVDAEVVMELSTNVEDTTAKPVSAKAKKPVPVAPAKPQSSPASPSSPKASPPARDRRRPAPDGGLWKDL
ncbi:ribosome biogenesis GTPase Der [Tuwongella immobilis]|uniref:GTPase Der n=1 Tax=Tuwongella immobilis TaxID=692036 RepID=A0A6C2YPF8_9BACT|nr:ribosome biogenesis GTPase Der [Tuwongella immobilis]VIP03284.1 ribosome-associated gtpase : GTPase Der OS=Pirellula staleyi (strain ATCC 27377 / DSM 6068 / ICPB 4128) GN=der PE=3 SV=1: MMR_HSR1: MMR_HSR1: KH_dom-like [Tuwongella immobilis]VTS03939.1 ribosome-associated gtpase : GTPase Der OS=Pirellula staleyi (strain ATCC 27377 / DSM 6068 / ICPB 4128) GN=der PE=3 SV=1: MMR_HSR1: MMR_HSR1: KH_dom-like [Tuwongella immobilis]